MSTKDVDLGRKKILQQLELAKGARVDVGILGAERHPDGDATIPEIGLIHEFGAPSKSIPERSFIRSTVDQKDRAYRQELRNSFANILLGRGTVLSELDQFGFRVTGDIQRKITAIRTPANSESTIEKKGFDNPLIETGTLRAFIKHRVKL